MPIMDTVRKTRVCLLAIAFVLALLLLGSGAAQAVSFQQGTSTQQTGSTRAVGTVQAINGSTVTLKPDSGPELTVNVPDTARMVRVAPGQSDIKSGTPIHVSDLQVADRMLVAGTPGEDGKSLVARTVVVMAKADVAASHAKEQQAWRQGVGGLVTSVEPAAGTVTVRSGLGAPVVIHTTAKTINRRYVQGSSKFEDAQPAKLDEIKAGDQLRARGTPGADGKEFTADEIVSGTFQNVAGRVQSVDAASGSVTVSDLLSKHPVTLAVTPGTELHQLPEQMATRIAMRMRAASENGSAGESHSEEARGENRPAGGPGTAGAGAAGGHGGPGFRSGRAPDFQQVLGFAPKITLADLKKGDAIMVVAMPGASTSTATALTLVAGVEPILTASPTGSGAAALLSSWNMSAPAGDTQGP